jgi:hypothetical protein
MAPETVSHAVVLDIREDGHQRWKCLVDRWDPREDDGPLRVSWNADRLPNSAYRPAAGGVVYVAAPPGYEQSRYSAAIRESDDPLRIAWTEGIGGDSLVLVALLPPGYAFDEMIEGWAPPDEAKMFDERMALLWPIQVPVGSRLRLSWRISPMTAEDGPRLCRQINDAVQLPHPRPEEFGDVPPALAKEWATATPRIAGVIPPEAVQQDDWDLRAGHGSSVQ